jgi:hypothetical protein
MARTSEENHSDMLFSEYKNIPKERLIESLEKLSSLEHTILKNNALQSNKEITPYNHKENGRLLYTNHNWLNRFITISALISVVFTSVFFVKQLNEENEHLKTQLSQLKLQNEELNKQITVTAANNSNRIIQEENEQLKAQLLQTEAASEKLQAQISYLKNVIVTPIYVTCNWTGDDLPNLYPKHYIKERDKDQVIKIDIPTSLKGKQVTGYNFIKFQDKAIIEKTKAGEAEKGFSKIDIVYERDTKEFFLVAKASSFEKFNERAAYLIYIIAFVE